MSMVPTHYKDIGIFLFKALYHFHCFMETLSEDKINMGFLQLLSQQFQRYFVSVLRQNNRYLIMSSQPELSREENHLTSVTQKSVELSVKGNGLKPDIYAHIYAMNI